MLLAAVAFFASCAQSDRDQWYIDTTHRLVLEKSTFDQVQAKLGPGKLIIGSELIAYAKQFSLPNEKEVNINIASRYQKGLYFSTMNLVVIVFFDDQDIARAFITGPQ